MMVDERHRRADGERVQPQRHLCQFDRHRVLVRAEHTSFQDHPLDQLRIVELFLRHGPIAVAGIIVDASGHNCIVLAPGANECLSVMDVGNVAQSIRDSKLLVCQLETPLQTVAAAIKVAHEAQVGVILNPAPARALDDSLLKQVNYLIVNEVEACQLSGIEVTDTASAQLASTKLLARGVGAVLLTMGEQGVFIASPNTTKFIPGISVNVVDTTAAGDTFVGAFAVGIACGLSFEAASIEAQYAAALTVTRLGAQTSIPYRAEVQAFMASRKAA